MASKSHAFPLFDDPVQMEPLLPGDQRAGMCRPDALKGLRFYFPRLWPEAEAGG